MRAVSCFDKAYPGAWYRVITWECTTLEGSTSNSVIRRILADYTRPDGHWVQSRLCGRYRDRSRRSWTGKYREKAAETPHRGDSGQPGKHNKIQVIISGGPRTPRLDHGPLTAMKGKQLLTTTSHSLTTTIMASCKSRQRAESSSKFLLSQYSACFFVPNGILFQLDT